MRPSSVYNELVNRWHDANGVPDGVPVKMHEYMGLTWTEYLAWVTGGDEGVARLRRQAEAD